LVIINEENLISSLFVHLGNFLTLQNPLGFVLLFIVVAITDIGIPLPLVIDSLVILTVYNSGPLSLSVLTIILVLLAGRQLGSGVLFVITRKLRSRLIPWLSKKFSSFSIRLESLNCKLEHKETMAIIAGRLTPGLLQITTIAAGSLRVKYKQFFSGVAISSLLYDGVLILIGFLASRFPGSNQADYKIWLLFGMILIVTIMWPAIILMSRNKNKNITTSTD